MTMLSALITLSAVALSDEAAPKCEAHFFPTDQVQGFTQLGDYGLITDLLEGGETPSDEMLAQIKADAQFEIAKRLFTRAGRLDGFAFVEHDQRVDYKTSTKNKARLTESNEPCYVEIVVTYISFSDSALSKRKVGVHFVTRDFRMRPDKPKILKLGGAALLAPHIKIDDDPEARPTIDFVGVYSEAFEAGINRFWRQ